MAAYSEMLGKQAKQDFYISLTGDLIKGAVLTAVAAPLMAEALTAVSNYVVFRTRTNGATDIFSAGGYRDRIVLDGESLRFAEKLVTFDTDRIDTLLVTPL